MPKKSFLYGITDDKYVKEIPENKIKKIFGIDTYKFKTPQYMKNANQFDHHDVSIVFKTSPETLLNLATKVVDAFPFPNVYTWNIEDICRWLRNYGYPQYQNAFRENLVNGHTLLLLDAAALSAMNIKDFNHIRHITYGIRKLYEFEMTKFGRSITLPPEYLYEQYKMFRVKTGRVFDTTKFSDLLRRMQLIREQRKYYDHWDALEHSLRMERDPKYRELFGAYKLPPKYPKNYNIKSQESIRTSNSCRCISPCKCVWRTGESQIKIPNRNIAYVGNNVPEKTRLDLLERLYPYKYGAFLYEVFEFDVEFYTRKSALSLYSE